MTKSPREPKAVKALIEKHRKQKLDAPRTVIGEATLWDRIRRRKQD